MNKKGQQCKLCNSSDIKLIPYYNERNYIKIKNYLKILAFFILRKDASSIGTKKQEFFLGSHLIYCNKCNFSTVTPAVPEKQLMDMYTYDYSQSNLTSIKSHNTPRSKSQYKYLCANIPLQKIKHELEFGAGAATLGRHIAIKNNIDTITVIEPGQCWELLYKNLSEINIDLYKSIFDLTNKKFNLIVSSHAVQGVSDLDLYFNYMLNLMNKNSFIFIEVPNRNKRWYRLKMNKGGQTNFFNKKSIYAMAKKYKLDLIDVGEYGDEWQKNKLIHSEKFKKNNDGRYLRFIFRKQ